MRACVLPKSALWRARGPDGELCPVRDAQGQFVGRLHVAPSSDEPHASPAQYLYLLFDEANWINQDDSNTVFTTEAHLLHLNSSDLHPASPTRRKLRASEVLGCVPYAPHHLSLYSRPGRKDSSSSFGLQGGIRGRPDFDFARHLVGIPLAKIDAAEARREWDGAQMCDGLIKEEPYTLEVVFTLEEGKHDKEDPS